MSEQIKALSKKLLQVTIPISKLVPFTHVVPFQSERVGTVNGMALQKSEFAYWIICDTDAVAAGNPGGFPSPDGLLMTAIKDHDGKTRVYARQFDPGIDRRQVWRFVLDTTKTTDAAMLMNEDNQEFAIIPGGSSDNDIQVETAAPDNSSDYGFWYLLPVNDCDDINMLVSYVMSLNSNKHLTISLDGKDPTQIVQFGTFTAASIWKFAPIHPPQDNG